MNQLRQRMLQGLFAVVLFSTPLAAQDAQNPIPVLSVDSLEIAYFKPKYVSADQLAILASRTLSREYYIEERGGRYAAPVSNIQQLGDSLVVYDELASVTRILATLEQLDHATEKGSQAASGVQRKEYRTRYMTLEVADDLLKPFRRSVTVDGRKIGGNVTYLEGQNVIVINDTSERIAEMIELLDRYDVPAPEVGLKCRLLMPGNGGGVPPELAEDLRALVPGVEFEQVGVAFLRTSVSFESMVKMMLGERPVHGGVAKYELSFRPTAFDSESGVLSVDRCKLINRAPGNNVEELFSTTITLRSSEATVLGASGATPVFVVVEIER